MFTKIILSRGVENEKIIILWDMKCLFPNLIFDLRADETRTKRQEKLRGCKMSDTDIKTYKLQCQKPSKGYCSTFVDNK